MKSILIFSGTTEGRQLAEILADAGIPATVCVATEYGEQVMPSMRGIRLHRGRMDQQKMQEFMGNGEFLAVVDATHPFATKVSRNIKQSAARQGIRYLRLQRDTKWMGQGAEAKTAIRYFAANEECAEALLQTEGNILLTTGSKELEIYCKNDRLRDRLYVRVLPSEESIALCRKHGLNGRQILAMQGPFLEELNLALLRQYDIQVLVTKESGALGGFGEKAGAAEKAGCSLYVIGNPEKQTGSSFADVCAELERQTSIPLRKAGLDEEGGILISLIGTGMGSVGTLTADAKQTIGRADYLFGAERLLAGICEQKTGKEGRKIYPYYLADDIIPILEEIPRGSRKEAAVLFSGDSGFYSGCRMLFQRLKKWKAEAAGEVTIRILPGISAVSYFAAACAISWQDAKLMSIHARGDRKAWEAELLSAVRYHKKVFLLVAGVEDVRAVGEILEDNGLEDCKIFLGYQLSYPDEKITECTPKACGQMTEDGLYILAILRKECESRFLAPCKKDTDFIRGRVPMTKEEIRELAVCKLRLKENAVVYDIGSGTGSVAAEIAARSDTILVYAIEQKEEGVCLIRQNREKFKLPNMEIIHGTAPGCLEGLKPATHAFIGGSGGNLKEILKNLYRKNPSMRVVLTAVTLETIGGIKALLEEMPVVEEEVIQLQVSRVAKLGEHHLMQAENPVFLFSFSFGESGG